MGSVNRGEKKGLNVIPKDLIIFNWNSVRSGVLFDSIFFKLSRHSAAVSIPSQSFLSSSLIVQWFSC